ncbi:MAG: hypothetical protein ABEJ93_04795 [Candidatus Nanohalobium sp.]
MKKLAIAAAIITVLTVSAAAADLNLTLKNSTGGTVAAEYTVLQNGEIVTQASDSLTADLNKNENYTVKQEGLTDQGWYNVTYHSFNVTQNLDPQTQLVKTSLPSDKEYQTDLTRLYAVETRNLKFEKAEIEIDAEQRLNRIDHCLSYDFQSSGCSNWQINSTGDYSSSYSSNVLEFNTSSFDGFMAGRTAPFPNITEIRIYDVTDTLDDETGGKLIEKGLNTSFHINQYSSSEYRFEFQVFNNGSEDWRLETGDKLLEKGLNSSWSVNSIWYFLGEKKTGGTFSSGTVSWDTGNNGILQVSGSNSSLTAKFLLDLSLDKQQRTNNFFNVSDTSEGLGTSADHSVIWNKLGDLNVTIQDPVNGTVLPRNHFFTVNATVECLNGDCGKVKASPRYNTSTGYEVVPESGTPFYVNKSSSKVCGRLSRGENCSVSWQVNATGDLKSWHRIDVNSSSNYSAIPEKASGFSEVQINQMVIMNLSWSELDFGYIDPGEKKAASGNEELKYNISFSEKSMEVDGLWVKGDDLVSLKDERYSISIRNVSMTTDRTSSNFTVTPSYKEILTGIEPGAEINTKYWLDVPLGITQGGYRGNITFKANATT